MPKDARPRHRRLPPNGGDGGGPPITIGDNSTQLKGVKKGVKDDQPYTSFLFDKSVCGFKRLSDTEWRICAAGDEIATVGAVTIRGITDDGTQIPVPWTMLLGNGATVRAVGDDIIEFFFATTPTPKPPLSTGEPTTELQIPGLPRSVAVMFGSSGKLVSVLPGETIEIALDSINTRAKKAKAVKNHD